MTFLSTNSPKLSTEEDIRQYMQEIRRIPLLTAEEERELARRCAQGDEEAIRQLVNANLRLVVAIARRYYNGTVPLPDLVQEGSIGLMAAARKFDYKRELRFSTYASKWIRQSVIRYMINHSNPIRVPAHMADMIRRVNEAQAQLRQELDHDPDIAQIAQRCNISEEKVEQVLQLQPKTYSLDASEDEDSPMTGVEDLQSPQPQQALDREEMNRIMEQLLSMLTPRQQQILRLRFGMDDGTCHSLEQVGNMLGISKERVRQVERQAMEKLKQLGTGVGLEDFLE